MGKETKELPVFDVDKPIKCPECGALDIEEENSEYSHEWHIDGDGIWYFTCFHCEHEWKAKAKVKVKRNE